jgi:cell division septation protein DedD
MGFLITCLIAFALGVERGRRYASSLSLPRPPPGQAAQAMAPPVKVAVAARQLIAQREMSINNPPLASGFTVQIASYQKREYAQREALSLNKRGITAIVIPKGSYFILCAGRFSDRRDAEQLLGRLKKQYRDCWIRRM